MPVTPTPPLVVMIEERKRRRLPVTSAEIRAMVDFSRSGGIHRLCDALEWFARIPLPDALHLKGPPSKEAIADLVTTRFYEHVADARSRGNPVRREHLRQIVLDCLP